MAETAQVTALEKIYAPGLISTVEGVAASATAHDPNLHCWYLGYGSNMSEQSFLKRRGIKPVRSLVVHAPGVQLAFDLPGLPYAEPRFANVVLLSDKDRLACHWDETSERPWGKGLVGVVYLVTLDDMAKIYATEGGGASYEIIQVECHEIGKGDKGETIKANTLYSSRPDRRRTQLGQPSLRYMNLLITGAKEKSLPQSYVKFLQGVDVYRRTTVLQTIALSLLAFLMVPCIIPLFTLARVLRNKKGEAPKWVQWSTGRVFKITWGIHDFAFRHLFGSGEVTKR